MPKIGNFEALQAAQFISLLENPNNLKADKLNELEKLRDKYPWFAAGHIMLCKVHKNENRFSYNSLLKKSSLYAGNRSKLYSFMNEIQYDTTLVGVDADELVEEPILEEQFVDSTADTIVEHLPEAKEALEEEVKEEVKEVEEIVQNKAEVEKEEDVKEVVEIDGNEISEDKEENISDEVKQIKEEHTVEQTIEDQSSNKIEKTQIDDYSSEETKKSSDEPKSYNPIEELQKFVDDEAEIEDELESLVPPVAYDPEKELQKLIAEQEEEDEIEEEVIEVADTAENEGVAEGFVAWLDFYSDEPEEKKKVKPKKPAKKASTKKAEKEDENDPQKLLENFIKNRPSIRRMKTDFYNPKDMAEKSDVLDEGLVTESLAKIHIKQGRPDLALKIYQKLKLQNPKKLAYFAARIEEVRRLIEEENV